MKFKFKELAQELKSLSVVFRVPFRTTRMAVRNGRNRKKVYPHINTLNSTANSIKCLLINLEINEIL